MENQEDESNPQKDKVSTTIGNIILFGSGETSEAGRRIHRAIFQNLSAKQRIAILETPAGFQPNSHHVAKEIADTFRTSLQEFIEDISIIPARKKGTRYSPDNVQLLAPLDKATYIFLGPGSPTYAASQLTNSKAWDAILARFKMGATICLSSAAAIAAGGYVLPVYEIYKAGSDLYWENGLNLFAEIGLGFTVVTHWNNTDGGKELDTRFCYMGEKRFLKLRKLLDKNQTILGIDEHTAIQFVVSQKIFTVLGRGVVTVLHSNKKVIFSSGPWYSFESFVKMLPIISKKKNPKNTSQPSVKAKKQKISKRELSKEIAGLLQEREKARKAGDYAKADLIRKTFEKKGYILEDSNETAHIYKKLP